MKRRTATLLGLGWLASIFITYKIATKRDSIDVEGHEKTDGYSGWLPTVEEVMPATPTERKLFDQIPSLGGGKDSLTAINAAFKFFASRGAIGRTLVQ